MIWIRNMLGVCCVSRLDCLLVYRGCAVWFWQFIATHELDEVLHMWHKMADNQLPVCGIMGNMVDHEGDVMVVTHWVHYGTLHGTNLFEFESCLQERQPKQLLCRWSSCDPGVWLQEQLVQVSILTRAQLQERWGTQSLLQQHLQEFFRIWREHSSM